MNDLSHCLAILQALGVSEIVYSLSGGGDSGTCELGRVAYLDGRETRALPALTIGITDLGHVTILGDILETIVADIPDGDWVNNEGGYGTVILRPQETDEALRVECDMTYGEESDEQDFEDDAFTIAEIDAEPVHPAFAALTIDDSNLHLPEGANP